MEMVFLTDAGHGWLVLDTEAQSKLGLGRRDFTEFSFISRTGVIYAEEDCDAAIVIAAHIREFGCEPDFVEHSVESANCRYYARCKGSPDWKAAHDYIKAHRAQQAVTQE